MTISNLRLITVLPLPIRILSSILSGRLETWGELNDDRADWLPRRSIIEQISIVISWCEKALIESKKMYMAFVDHSRALDTVLHESLWTLLLKKGFSKTSVAASNFDNDYFNCEQMYFDFPDF